MSADLDKTQGNHFLHTCHFQPDMVSNHLGAPRVRNKRFGTKFDRIHLFLVEFCIYSRIHRDTG